MEAVHEPVASIARMFAAPSRRRGTAASADCSAAHTTVPKYPIPTRRYLDRSGSPPSIGLPSRADGSPPTRCAPSTGDTMSISPLHRPTLPRSIRPGRSSWPAPWWSPSRRARWARCRRLPAIGWWSCSRAQTLSEIAAAARHDRRAAGGAERHRQPEPDLRRAAPARAAGAHVRRQAVASRARGPAPHRLWRDPDRHRARYGTTIGALVIRERPGRCRRASMPASCLRISGSHRQARRAHGGSQPSGGGSRPAPSADHDPRRACRRDAVGHCRPLSRRRWTPSPPPTVG